MPENCKLTADLLFTDCTSLEIGGVSGVVYLMNYSEYLTATIVRGVDKSITDITLTEIGAQAVKYDLPRGATVASTPLTINNGGKSGFVHTLSMFLPTKSQAIKTELTGKVNFGRIVAVLVLDSSIVAQVFGNDIGLQMTAFDETPNNPSNGGGCQITLTTPADTTLENLPPVTFGAGTAVGRSATLAKLEALTIPVV